MKVRIHPTRLEMLHNCPVHPQPSRSWDTDFQKVILTQIRINLNVKPIVLKNTFKSCKYSPVLSVKLNKLAPGRFKMLGFHYRKWNIHKSWSPSENEFPFLHAAYIAKQNKLYQQVWKNSAAGEKLNRFSGLRASVITVSLLFKYCNKYFWINKKWLFP